MWCFTSAGIIATPMAKTIVPMIQEKRGKCEVHLKVRFAVNGQSAVMRALYGVSYIGQPACKPL